MNVWHTKQLAEWLGFSEEGLRKLLRKEAFEGMPYKRIGNGPKARFIFIEEKVKEYFTRDEPYVTPRKFKAVA